MSGARQNSMKQFQNSYRNESFWKCVDFVIKFHSNIPAIQGRGD